MTAQTSGARIAAPAAIALKSVKIAERSATLAPMPGVKAASFAPTAWIFARTAKKFAKIAPMRGARNATAAWTVSMSGAKNVKPAATV